MTKMKKVLTGLMAALALSAAVATPAAAGPYAQCGPNRPCTPVPCPSGLAPDTIGMTPGAAIDAFASNGFANWAIVFYTGPLGTPGLVLATNPVPGSFFPKCNQVLITVKN